MTTLYDLNQKNEDDVDDHLTELEEELYEWIEIELKENADEYFSFENREMLFNELFDIFQFAFAGYGKLEFPPSFVSSFIRQRMDLYFQEFYIEGTIKRLQEVNLSLPKQRTDEWYIYRHDLLTASNVYKVFGSIAQLNSLILEKCQDGHTRTNFSAPSCEWGKKYEPLSVLLYEEMYNTKVQEFGCFQHPKWNCLGASPDGIVIGNQRYGRMLEIKNIVNRDITGEPLHHYWIQMQVQMEVCDLDVCDFLETRFKECVDVNEWTLVPHKKGCIITNTINITNDEDDYCGSDKLYYIWDPEKMSMTEFITCHSNAADIRWWYLDEWSCVKILRDRIWFQNALPKILETWEIILKERKDGFEHRRPKPRAKGVLFLF